MKLAEDFLKNLKDNLSKLKLCENRDVFNNNSLRHARIIGCLARFNTDEECILEIGRTFSERRKQKESAESKFIGRYRQLYNDLVGVSWKGRRTEIDLILLDQNFQPKIVCEYENKDRLEIIDNIAKFQAFIEFFHPSLCVIGFWAGSDKLVMKEYLEKLNIPTFKHHLWLFFALYGTHLECDCTCALINSSGLKEEEFRVCARA